MMDAKAALVRSCVEDPDDELCRYALADWLEENGEDATAARVRSGDLEDLGGGELDAIALRALLRTREPVYTVEPVTRTMRERGVTGMAYYEWIDYFDDLRQRNVRKTYALTPYLIPRRLEGRLTRRSFRTAEQAKAALLEAAEALLGKEE